MLKCFDVFCHKMQNVVPFFLHSMHLDEARELVQKIQMWIDEVAAVAEVIPPIAPAAAIVDRVVDGAASVIENAIAPEKTAPTAASPWQPVQNAIDNK